MNRNSWTRYLVAAALVLLVGAVWVLAEEKKMKVEVRNDGGQEITVDVNGETEVIALDDLADGEERTFDVGGHPVTVKRVDDQLALVHEGHVMGKVHHFGGGDEDMVWVTAGDEDEHGAHRVKIMKKGDCGGGEEHQIFIMKGADGEIDTEGIDLEDIDIEVLEEKYGDELVKIYGHGPHPMIVKSNHHFVGGDYVQYRCEETGSTLTVKKEEALLDSYIDPVTSCVLEKVDEPMKKVIRVEVIEEEETEE